MIHAMYLLHNLFLLYVIEEEMVIFWTVLNKRYFNKRYMGHIAHLRKQFK